MDTDKARTALVIRLGIPAGQCDGAVGSTLAAPSREAPPWFQLAEQKQGEQLPVSDLHPFPADMMSILRKTRGTFLLSLRVSCKCLSVKH